MSSPLTATDQINQLISAIGSSSGSVPMTQNNNAASLSPFLSSPMYTAMFGQNAANQVANTGQYNPTTSFQADPGFAYNQQQTANAMQQNGAAKGLLESGSMQQALTNTMQGNQNNMYQTWLGQQNNLMNSYQSQLNSLMQFGASNTGATQAQSQGQLLGQLTNSDNIATGQNTAQTQLTSAQDQANLLANQGVYNSNAYLNTGAALAGIQQQDTGLNMQAANNNQASSNLSSLFSGSNALAGTSSGTSTYTGSGNGTSTGGYSTYY